MSVYLMASTPEALPEEAKLRQLMAAFENEFPGMAEQIKNLTAQRLSVLLTIGVGQMGSAKSSAGTLE
jgi:hypothetical protein